MFILQTIDPSYDCESCCNCGAKGCPGSGLSRFRGRREDATATTTTTQELIEPASRRSPRRLLDVSKAEIPGKAAECIFRRASPLPASSLKNFCFFSRIPQTRHVAPRAGSAGVLKEKALFSTRRAVRRCRSYGLRGKGSEARSEGKARAGLSLNDHENLARTSGPKYKCIRDTGRPCVYKLDLD